MEKNETENLYDESKNDDELTSDEKIILQWYRENPLSLVFELILMKMLELEIISPELHKQIQSEVVKKKDILKELSRKQGV